MSSLSKWAAGGLGLAVFLSGLGNLPVCHAEGDTIVLFNGKTLEGWKGHQALWSVKNHVLVGRNTEAVKRDTFLVTTQKFKDFRLTGYVKRESGPKAAHTGIAFWGTVDPSEGDEFAYTGLMLRCPQRWGLFDLNRRGDLRVDGERADRAGKAADWNEIELLAVGNRVRLAVNGAKVIDWRDPKPQNNEAGPIGLLLPASDQAQEFRFRDLMLTLAPEDKLTSQRGQ